MSEITEIQDLVFSSMKIRATVPPSTYTLLDYFLPRQYIQVYSPNLVTYAIRDIGICLLKFASLIDNGHPDIATACEGQFSPGADFYIELLEILEAGKVLFDAKRGNLAPSVMTSFLYKKYPNVINYIRDPANYIRLVNDIDGRVNLRLFCSQNFVLFLNKPHIWHKMPGSFRQFVRRGPGENYGFRRMTMTNAAVILSKITNSHPRNAHIFTTVPRLTPYPPAKINNFIDALEKFPDAGNKPIFDKYWVVESGSAQALLGEREKKTFFIICWD